MRTGFKRWAPRLGLALIPVVLAIGGELLARRAAGSTPPVLMRVSPLFEKFMYDLNSDFFKTVGGKDGERFLVPNRSVDVQRDTRFPLRKSPGTFRIFCVGESTVGLGQFSRYLDAYLKVLRPDARFEVVNAGQGFINPPYVLKVFRETLKYEPDLIVVYMGHNYAHEISAMTPWQYRVQAVAGKSALVRWIAGALRPVGDPDRGAKETAEARFAASLEEMARLARSRGLPLIVCTPASNLLHPPPGAPRFGDHGPEFRLRYGEALTAYDRGDFDRADALFQRLSRTAPESALFPFYLGVSAQRKGDFRRARLYFEKARDLDDNDRAPTALIRLIRDKSRTWGYRVADVEREFSGAAPHGIPGFDLFIDPCHPNPSVYQHVVRPILRTIETAGLAPGTWRWGDLARAEPRLIADAGGPRSVRGDAQMLFNSGLIGGLKVTFQSGVFSEECARYFEEALRMDPALFPEMIERSRGKTVLRQVLSYTAIDESTIQNVWVYSMIHAAIALRRRNERPEARRLLRSLLEQELPPSLRSQADVQLAVTADEMGDAAERDERLAQAERLGAAGDPFYLALKSRKR
ncbi:MAG: hypothetical protein ACHQ2Z_09840 [Elusimicrobiota bacterium]